MDYQRLTDGIQVFENDRSLRRSYSYSVPDYGHYGLYYGHYGPALLERFEFEGGSDIQSITGKRATFQQDPRVHHDRNGAREEGFLLFQFVVWDD
uniref:AraC family transcriptional regulator n=1 Tax=Caenorhabditis tropicalis TaxID=1561998 RepID=A0A1I7TS23_9PELO